MQITLNQAEIEDAIETYVRNQITIADNQEIVMDFKAGRSDAGYTVTLDIQERQVSKAAAKASAPKPATRATKHAFVAVTPDPEPEVEVETENFIVPDEVAIDSNGNPAEEAVTEAAGIEGVVLTDEAPKAPSIFNFGGAA